MLDLELLDRAVDSQHEIIYTSAVELVETALTVWLNEPEPSLMLIVGVFGVGKSMGINYLVQQLSPRPHTGLRPCEIVIVPEKSTRLSLPQTILTRFHERPKKRSNSPALVQQTIEFLRDNEIRILFLDEGDRFIKDSIEVIKDFYDASVRRELNCRFVIVGLPEMLDLIEDYGQLSSRAPSIVIVEPLDETEIIDKFLPNLTISRWRFDPNNKIDQELAKLMWQRTRPVLRLLVFWISKASGVAKLRQKEWITFDEIDTAAGLLKFSKSKLQEIRSTSEGIHERVSELRNAANALKSADK